MTGLIHSFCFANRRLLWPAILVCLALARPAYAQGPVVNTTADNESDTCAVNNCTLREAITDAANGDTITFYGKLSGQTI
ncbi:MAG: CSLREA domain-containing protein, partial [Chloroflexi bacterium]